jgi:hypothetical protein
MDYDSAARTLSRYTQSIRELRLAVAVSGLTVEEAWTKVDEEENPDADPDRALPVLKASDDMQAALEQANAVLRDLAPTSAFSPPIALWPCRAQTAALSAARSS